MDALRNYQQEMLQNLYKAWKRHRSIMVQMPTGTGKTHLMAEIVREFADKGVLVVAHRIELIEQISQTLEMFGVAHGQIVSGKHVDGTNRVQVASIQTLARRIDYTECAENAEGFIEQRIKTDDTDSSLNALGRELATDFSLIIIDEAHHALAETYRMLWEKWPKAKFLGLTATPCRLNNAPFTDLFQKLLQSWNIQEFIEKGWLSDFEYVSACPGSAELQRVALLQKRGADGDYQTKELATVMDCPESIEHLFKTYQEFAGGKKGIVYAINREHAKHISDYYAEQGVRCAVIDSKTPAKERQRIIEDYKASPSAAFPLKRLPVAFLQGERGVVRPAVAVLVNVDIFGEGFDCPEVEFIQLARPTLSLSKYLQQVGRGMRVSEGKPHVLILDNVGLYQTFGLPTEERDWRRTFYGLASGKGDTDIGRYVVVDGDTQEKELVNLEMVRIKKGGQRSAGLEIFLKDGRYGVMSGGKVTCEARFKRIERLKDGSGYFAAGIYNGMRQGRMVEYSSLIDKKGTDLNLRLFRDVVWMGGYFYSSYKLPNYKKGDWFWWVYWDPKGNCYYDDDPEFRIVAGVEMAYGSEHFHREALCLKLRYNTGLVSPRFNYNEIFYNRHVIVARDYLIVKKDHNHAYQIKGFLPDSILVQEEGGYGYLQIFKDGRKGQLFRSLPPETKRSIFQVQMLGLERV